MQYLLRKEYVVTKMETESNVWDYHIPQFAAEHLYPVELVVAGAGMRFW